MAASDHALSTERSRALRLGAWTQWLGVAPFFLFVLAFQILPSLNLFLGAFQDQAGHFTLANFLALSDRFVIKSYMVSLQVSVITSVVGGVFGFMIAYAITVGNAPRWMRNVLMTFSGLAANFGGVPLAFAFIATLGHTGFLTAILRNLCIPTSAGVQTCPFDLYRDGFNLYTLTGLTLCYTYFQFPLMVLTIAPALESLRREWREAAENMGANGMQYWWDVALPVLWPSLLGATLLLFASAFGAYATAEALTGGSIPLATILVGEQITGDVLGNPNEGYAVAFGMVVIMSLCIAVYMILQQRTAQWLKR
ncbi:MAG TPA: ABC transporter permease subunit [Aggregatilineaceae bacterium]|nr:ABC transporter permease subunit [Aggregatilineaceae bacterium]